LWIGINNTIEDIFKVVDQKVKEFGLYCKKCVNVCTSEALSMKVRKKGFVAHAIQQNPNVKIIHCMIHKKILVSKALSSELSVV